jgi:predicted transglutaminase-like cysteine proteinase
MDRVCSRALSAFVLLVSLAALSSPAAAGTAQAAAHPQALLEPYGSRMLMPTGGAMLEKWAAVLRQWKIEKQTLDACRAASGPCSDPAARELLSIVEAAKPLTGLAQLGQINRAVNLAIRPVDDLVAHGAIDVWSSPLATLATHAGDCEDYAIVKFVALLEAGIAPADLRVLIVRDVMRAEDHAVVAVRHESQWLLLDNRRLVIRADAELANYQPLMQMDGTGARRYLEISTASRTMPDAAPTAEIELEPAALSSLPW